MEDMEEFLMFCTVIATLILAGAAGSCVADFILPDVSEIKATESVRSQ